MSNAPKTKVLVVDPGTGWVKAGFPDDRGPSAVVRYGTNKPLKGQEGSVVVDWAALEQALARTFRDELRVKPSEHAVLLAHAPDAPRAEREKLLGVLFDRFEVPQAALMPTSVLALHATGRTTGVVVDIGDALTSVAAVHEGKAMDRPVRRSVVAGRTVTAVMGKRLADEGIDLSAAKEIVRDVVEKFGYVAGDYEKEKARSAMEVLKIYELPGGEVIEVVQARFEAPEALFEPDRFGLKAKGMQELLLAVVEGSNADIRAELYANVFLAGGGSLIAGLAERLSTEIGRGAPRAQAHVYARPGRKHMAWQGGSSLATAGITTWITRSAYNDKGTAVLDRP
ncbi:hypothetical protein [Streptomyces collinus]|uniref:hypothetical protein n=1 Tax=Streptomyces collinus TaxID=42684 RepID=UPI003692CE69